MRSIEVRLPVPAERVFSALEDPDALGIMVPGARRIRRFDPHWPEPGAEVHHSVGLFPFAVRDRTVVVECVQDERLVLEARVQMLGVFVVEFQLEPDGSGTRLQVGERVVAGILGFPLLRPVAELVVALRNVELGRRLRRLIDQRNPYVGEAARD